MSQDESPPDLQPAELPFVYRTWQTFATDNGLPHNSIRALRVRGDQVWVGTEGGLAMFESGAWKTWTRLDSAAGEPLPVISAIDIDHRTEDIWLGTWGGGLLRLSGGRFDRFDQFNSGLAGNLVFALAVVDGRVWAATNGGISSFDPIRDAWSLHLERRADARRTAVTSLSPDPSGAILYVAAWFGGLWRIDLRNSEVGILVGLSSGPAEGAGHDRAGPDTTTLAVHHAGGVLWWAAQTRLARRGASQKWETRRIVGRESPDDFILCLAGRDETEAWLGADRGLYVLADWTTDTWVAYRRCDANPQLLVTLYRNGRILETHLLDTALPDNRIRCVAFQGHDVWVGTAGGLARGMGSGRWSGLRPAQRRPVRGAATGRAASGPRATPLNQAPLRRTSSGQGRAVAVGVLFPLWKTVPLPGAETRPATGPARMDVSAVQLAVEQANARGGYRGQAPFTVPLDQFGYARWGWNMPEDDFVTLAYLSEVRGMVGYLEPGSPYATAAALRTEVPVVNAAPAPPTPDEAMNPWMFRCPGADPNRQKKLLDYLIDGLGHTRLAVVRTPGREAQVRLDRWAALARDAGHPPAADLTYDPQTGGLDPVLEAIQRCRAEVVLTWCDAAAAAALLRRMRRAGMSQLLVGGGHLVTEGFADLIGCDPGPVMALWDCSACGDEAAARFAAGYEARFKRPAPPQAFRCYRAARHLLRAINLAGLERDAIRQTCRDMSGAFLARLDEGRWQFYPASDR